MIQAFFRKFLHKFSPLSGGDAVIPELDLVRSMLLLDSYSVSHNSVGLSLVNSPKLCKKIQPHHTLLRKLILNGFSPSYALEKCHHPLKRYLILYVLGNSMLNSFYRDVERGSKVRFLIFSEGFRDILSITLFLSIFTPIVFSLLSIFYSNIPPYVLFSIPIFQTSLILLLSRRYLKS